MNGNGTALEPLHRPAAPQRASQATAIEQSRAIAQVQAMVIVAQQCPRSVNAAIEAMEEACRQPELAARAFFRFPRSGETVSGPSVHLARELARCWGNIEHGVTELRRDDLAAESEMQAFAWDLQTNTRSASIFIVPHKRDTKKGVRDLTDMRDIYENNANNGARRLREAVFSVLPVWYRERAMALCTETLEDGGGKPLAQRIADAVRAFERHRVSPARLAAKFGHGSVDELTASDVAQLGVIYESLKQGTVTVDDEFPAETDRITPADIAGPKDASPAQAAAPVAAEPPTDPPRAGAGEAQERPPALIATGQKNALGRERQRLGYGESEQDWDDWLADLAKLAGLHAPIASPAELTQAEAKHVLNQLRPLDAKALRQLLDTGEVPDGQ
jgi:hypothetical protein